MKALDNLRLRMRYARRLATFTRAVRGGMTNDQARARTDDLFPPSAEDLALEAALRRGDAPPLPLASAAALLVPIIAGLHQAEYTHSPTDILGYALRVLSYVLIVAGVVNGTFGVLNLNRRSHVFICAGACLVIGEFLVRISV